MRSHKVATVPILQFDPSSTLKLRSALHFRYSIVIEAGLGTTSIYCYSRSEFTKLLFLFNYRIHTCFTPLIANDNIKTVCEYDII